MNLHEQCLLKYLSNPAGFISTLECLQNNNLIISKKSGKEKSLANKGKISYTANRLWE